MTTSMTGWIRVGGAMLALLAATTSSGCSGSEEDGAAGSSNADGAGASGPAGSSGNVPASTGVSSSGAPSTSSTSSTSSGSGGAAASSTTGSGGSLIGGSVSQLAAMMAPGTFAEMTGMNGWDGGLIMSPPAPCVAQADVITQYANHATWNPVNPGFQFIGTPHGSNCGLQRNVRYDEATNTWSTLPVIVSGPTVEHAYDHNAMGPDGTQYYRLYNSSAIYKLPVGAPSWSALPLVPQASKQCCGALSWFPDQNRLIFVDGDWGGWSWSPGTNSWAQLFMTNGNDGSGLPQYPMGGTGNFAEYSELGYLVFGGGSSPHIYRMNAAGAVVAMPPAPFGNLPTSGGASCCSVTHDPVTGKIVVIDGSTQKVWELDPSGSGSWKDTGIIAPANLNSSESLISAPVPAYGVIFIVKCNDSSACFAYLYKHDG